MPWTAISPFAVGTAGDVLARVDTEVVRLVPTERDAPDRPGDKPQADQAASGRRQQRTGCRLAIERHRCDVGEVVDGARAAGPEGEVGRRRPWRGKDLLVEPARHVGGALRMEHAERSDVPVLHPRAAGDPFGLHQLAAVPDRFRVTEPAELVAVPRKVSARGDRSAGRIEHPSCHHEHVPRVLLERFVRACVQRPRRDVPDDLVDTDPAANARLTLEFRCVAVARGADRGLRGTGGRLHQEDGVAGSCRDIDVAIERDREARVLVEAIELVEHGDVVAVGLVGDAVRRQRQGDPATGILSGIGHGESVAGERTGSRTGQVEQRVNRESMMGSRGKIRGKRGAHEDHREDAQIWRAVS